MPTIANQSGNTPKQDIALDHGPLQNGLNHYLKVARALLPSVEEITDTEKKALAEEFDRLQILCTSEWPTNLLEPQSLWLGTYLGSQLRESQSDFALVVTTIWLLTERALDTDWYLEMSDDFPWNTFAME